MLCVLSISSGVFGTVQRVGLHFCHVENLSLLHTHTHTHTFHSNYTEGLAVHISLSENSRDSWNKGTSANGQLWSALTLL